eukprot:s4045_g4.t1
MFDFEDIEADVERKGADAWQEKETAEGSGGAGTTPSGPGFAHRRPGAAAIEVGKKVIIRGAPGAPELEEKIGEIMAFEGGKYSVKVMNLTGGYVPGRALNEGSHMRLLAPESLELHPDQVEKDRQAAEDGAIVLLGGSEAERAAREALYSLSIDPKHCYDKAVERILAARHEFEVLNLEVKWYGSDLSPVKRAYRRISVGIHPDKNSHPQAVDCFRKVYGAFETLMDKKQQWRLLFILNRLKDDEINLYELEAEEEERFEWWLEANVPEIEKQAAEIEGGEFEEIGEKWISDGTGGNVNDVKWAGMAESLRLHAEDKAVFIDCRERFEFEIEHIDGAFNIPMREFVDFGLAGVAGPWVKEVLKRKDQPVIIYSEVATPFSRCRAMCRWLLRAGSKSLPAERLRRLRGGMFGWRHKKGKIVLAIKDITPEQKAALYRDSARQIGALKGLGSPVNLRVRVRWFEERCAKVPGGGGGPCAMLHDSSGGILTFLTTKEQIALCREAANRQGSLLVRGATCELSSDKHLVARLGPEATLERSDRDFTFGFDAKNVERNRPAVESAQRLRAAISRRSDRLVEQSLPARLAATLRAPTTQEEEQREACDKVRAAVLRGEASSLLSHGVLEALLSLGDTEQTSPEIRQACLRSLCLIASGRDRDDLEAADARMQMRGKLDTPSPAAADARSRLRAALREEGHGLLRRLGKRCRGHGGSLSQLALLLSYCQEPEDEAALELLAEALDVDEAEVSKAALVSLNAIFDARRQQGSSGKAVVFNPGLRRCLEVGLNVTDHQELLHGFLAEVFTLLADNDDRPRELQVDVPGVGLRLLEPFLQSQDAWLLRNGLAGLACLLASRAKDAALILQMSAVPLSAVLNALARPVPGPEGRESQGHAAECLLLAASDSRTRQKWIEGGGIDVILNALSNTDRGIRRELVDAKLVAVLAIMAAHNKDVRDEIFDRVDFMMELRFAVDVAGERARAAQTHEQQRQARRLCAGLYESFAVLAIHGEFKDRLIASKKMLGALQALAKEEEPPVTGPVTGLLFLTALLEEKTP